MKLKQSNPLEMGERIRKYRELLGLTREDLAYRLDVTSKFIADVECGAKGMSLKRFCLLVQTLGVSADYLLLGESPRKRLVYEVKCYVE